MALTQVKLLLLLLSFITATAQAFEIFVSPSGNDEWTGLISDPNADASDGPLKTLTKAQEILRQMKIKNQFPLETAYVSIRGGDYHIQETWSFSAEDSGTSSDMPIIYRAYNNEKVRILGSMALSGWSAATNDRLPDASGVWQVCGDQVANIFKLNNNESFHSLFVNGNRAIRAKIPNSGYLYYDTSFTEPDLDVWNADGRKGFYYREGDLNPDWHNIQDINIVYFYSWTTEWNYIGSIHAENRTVYFNTLAGLVPGSFSKTKRYYVENVLEGLDQPREWYFDKTNMCVYYYPTAWEDMNGISVEVPVLQVLLSLDNGASHLRFEGLHFENADWQIYASDNIYFASGQAAAITDKLRGSLNIYSTDDITFDNITVHDIGVYGVFVENSTNFHIRNSHLYDLGAGGIWIRTQVDAAEVYNNYVHSGGRVFEAAVGIMVHSSNNDIQIHNNEVADFSYTGISVGWTWGHGSTSATNISIAYNRVHLIGKMVLSDLGGIYTLGEQPGTVVKGNHIYQVQGYVGTAFGSYNDEGSSYIVVSDNIIHDAASGTMLVHYGALLEARNNVLIPGGAGMAFHLPKSKTDDFDWTIEKNVVLPTGDPVYRVYPPDWSSDNNLFLNPGCDIQFDDTGMDFNAWQTHSNKDLHSRWVDFDMLNMDAVQQGDFSTLPTNDVAELGITLPDISAIGLRSNMASLTKEYPVDSCRVVEDFTFDMEMYNKGDVFASLLVRCEKGMNAEDSIDFSDELPSLSSGTRSLKLTTGVGWYAPWLLLTGPGFSEGRVIFKFDAYFPSNDTGVWLFRNAAQGPNLVIVEQEMQIHGLTVDTVPTQTWVRFTVSYTIGIGNYSYTIQDLTNNGPVKEYWFEDSPICGSNQWKFITLNGIGESIYLDNIHIGAVQPSVTVTSVSENAVRVTYQDNHVPVCGLEVYVDNALYKHYGSTDLTGKSGQVTLPLDGVLTGQHDVHVVAKTNNARAKSSVLAVAVTAPPVSPVSDGTVPLNSPKPVLSSASVGTVGLALYLIGLVMYCY